jgi:hypothetical protein
MPYGQPAPFRLIPRFNPITVAVDLIDAIGQGIRDATAVPGAAPQPMTAVRDVPHADVPHAVSTPAPIRLAAAKPARQRSTPAALPSPASASSTASPGTVEKAEQRPGRKTAGRGTTQSIRSAAA